MKKIIVMTICFLLSCANVLAAEALSSLEQARIAYICALADMAVYSTSMNEAIREEMKNFGWEFVSFKNKDSRADTTYYTVTCQRNPEGEKNTLIVIPGTEKMKDVEVDFRFGKVLYGGTNPQEFRDYAAVEKTEASQPMVHRGFNDYTMTAFFTENQNKETGADSLLQYLDEPGEHLYITGHSLGGAVAALLGARLVSSGVEPDRLSIFTFGAPTIGNTAFAEEYGYRLDLSRYTMGGDMVKNALQMLKSGYVHFGTEYKLEKNKNSRKYSHSMALYLDAAARNYYDELLQGDFTVANMIRTKEKTVREADGKESNGEGTGIFSLGSSNRQHVYLAPVYFALPEQIANDKDYMQAVAADMLAEEFASITSQGEQQEQSYSEALFAACQAAEDNGCGTVAMLTIAGTANKEKADAYSVAAEIAFYNTVGVQLMNTMASTSTQDITPIEAVMYDMARITQDIRQAQEEAVLPSGVSAD